MFLIGIQLKSPATYPGLVTTVTMQQKQSMNPGDTSKDHQAATNIATKLAEDVKKLL